MNGADPYSLRSCGRWQLEVQDRWGSSCPGELLGDMEEGTCPPAGRELWIRTASSFVPGQRLGLKLSTTGSAFMFLGDASVVAANAAGGRFHVCLRLRRLKMVDSDAEAPAAPPLSEGPHWAL